MNRQLQNIHLRRIEWAISSPSLLAYPFCTNYFKDEEHEEMVMQKLRELDQHPELANAHFQHLGYMPMGKYFEQLVFFMLKNDSRFELLLANHQIIEGNRTIGELDLIVKDIQTNKREHWEMALKFYLQSDSSPEHQKMIGPNAVDNLGRKMEKLIKHQLPLSKHSSIRYLVGAEKTEPKLFLKGQLFYHLGNPHVLPLNANPHHEKHWWCHVSEIDEMITDDLEWYILEKPNWIGPHQTNDDSKLHSSDRIKELMTDNFKQKNRSILLAGMARTETGWMEQTRGFIVSNDWPNITLNN